MVKGLKSRLLKDLIRLLGRSPSEIGYTIERAGVIAKDNEAPRSKLRGIKAELRRSQTRLCSTELWRGSPRLSSLQQAAGYFGEGE
jgi:hypothetical protein